MAIFKSKFFLGGNLATFECSYGVFTLHGRTARCSVLPLHNSSDSLLVFSSSDFDDESVKEQTGWLGA